MAGASVFEVNLLKEDEPEKNVANRVEDHQCFQWKPEVRTDQRQKLRNGQHKSLMIDLRKTLINRVEKVVRGVCEQPFLHENDGEDKDDRPHSKHSPFFYGRSLPQLIRSYLKMPYRKMQ